MTIHDELILALTPNEKGEGGYLHKMVGTKRITYKVEETVYLTGDHPDYLSVPAQTITPDITVSFRDNRPPVAIELETDVNWDFGESLRQIKKYQQQFGKGNVKVIIPKEYERFARLYRNEDFPVYLWTATRIWECMQCGKITYEQRTIKPKCSVKSCSSNEQRLKGIKVVTFKEAEQKLAFPNRRRCNRNHTR